MKTITKVSDFPKDEHYAVIVFATISIYHAGYDDHDSGYNENREVVEYIAFDTVAALEKWIIDVETKSYSYGTTKPVYKVISSKPLAAKIQASVKLGA